jgi:hypothetical protein
MFAIKTHDRRLLSASKTSAILNQNNGMENLEVLDVSENSNHAQSSPTHVVTPVKSTLNDALKRNEKKNSQIKDLIVKEMTNEGIQSILKILFSDHIVLRLFWFLCVIVSTGLCSYLVLQSIFSYLAFEVSTSKTNKLEDEIDFPKITICKLVYFLQSYVNTLMINRHSRSRFSLKNKHDFYLFFPQKFYQF